MKIEQLKYFKIVVEEKSIHKAAEILYISQPNISRAISNLEDEIGVSLLVRNNRGVTLTKVGESFYHYAKSIIEQMDAIQHLSKLKKENMIGQLKLSVARIFLKDDLLLNYYNHFDNVQKRITFLETNIDGVLQNVSDLTSELGIIVVNSYQFAVMKKIVELQGLEMEVLGKSPFCVHLSERNQLSKQSELHMCDLLSNTILNLPEDYFFKINFNHTFGGVHVTDFKNSLQVNNYHATIHMINHADICMFGHRWQEVELSKSKIVTIPVVDVEIEMILIWIKRKKEILSCEAEYFINNFKSNYGAI